MPRFYKYHVNTSYFADIDTPNKAYWLGALAADGCLYYNHNKWVFQFIVSLTDREWLDAFRREIGSEHPTRILPGGFGTPCIRLVIVNQAFCSPLLAIGLKSSDILQRIPKRLWPHFLRGIFDGDGSILEDVGKPRHTGYEPRTLQWSLVSQSRDLLESFQSVFVENCDIALNKLRFHNNVWRWSIRGNKQVRRIYQYLYPEEEECAFLQRKRARFVFE